MRTDMTIEHDFFGILGGDDVGEVYWTESAELAIRASR